MSRRTEYLEAAADRVMIQDMLARYAWEIDHGTPEGFAAVFAEDGVFEVVALKLRVEGTRDIVSFAKDLQRTMPNLHHVMSNFVINISGNRASGRCELNEFMALPDAIYPNVQGWYEDDYVFDGERWRIQRRCNFFAPSAAGAVGPLAEYSAAFMEACAKYQHA